MKSWHKLTKFTLWCPTIYYHALHCLLSCWYPPANKRLTHLDWSSVSPWRRPAFPSYIERSVFAQQKWLALFGHVFLRTLLENFSLASFVKEQHEDSLSQIELLSLSLSESLVYRGKLRTMMRQFKWEIFTKTVVWIW